MRGSECHELTNGAGLVLQIEINSQQNHNQPERVLCAKAIDGADSRQPGLDWHENCIKIKQVRMERMI